MGACCSKLEVPEQRRDSAGEWGWGRHDQWVRGPSTPPPPRYTPPCLLSGAHQTPRPPLCLLSKLRPCTWMFLHLSQKGNQGLLGLRKMLRAQSDRL